VSTAAGLPLTQVGVVVRDLRAAMRAYHELCGWAPWYVYEYAPPFFHDAELYGAPAEFTFLGAEVQAGPVWFELIQPLEGRSLYTDFLEEHGEGLHHVLVGWDPEEQAPGAAGGDGEPASLRTAREARDRFAASGVGVLMSGKLGASTEFFYLDTAPVTKVVLELAGGSPADLTPVETYP
jgi:hypothetical protein